MSYSEIYEEVGSKSGLMIQDLVGKDNKVIMMNICRACYGIPNSNIQGQEMTDYTADMATVYFGTPKESMEAIKKTDINYIWIDTNEKLLSIAYAPLFDPGTILNYLKIVWNDQGKYLLTWDSGDNSSGELKNKFTEDYVYRREQDEAIYKGMPQTKDMKLLYFKFKETYENGDWGKKK